MDPSRKRNEVIAGAGITASLGIRLRPQDLVMTLLGTYMRGNQESVWSGGVVQLLSDLGFTTGGARVALSRLAERDLIERVRSGRLVFYRPTPRAKRVIRDGDRRIFTLGKPRSSASWTMVWHDIPEAQRVERGKLARRLRFLGFGSLQDGVWVSPLDQRKELTRLLDDLDLTDDVSVMVGKPIGEAGKDLMLRSAWDLDGLCGKYREFALEFGPHVDGRGDRLDDGEAFVIRTLLVHLYRSFPALDPGLPDSSMPDPEARLTAVATFERGFELLQQPAQRYFDSVVRAETTPAQRS